MKKIFFVLVSMTISSFVSAETLYDNSAIGIQIGESKDLVSVDSKLFGGGFEAIRFNYDHNKFIVTGLLQPHKSNIEYPKTKQVAEVVFDQSKKRYPDMLIVSESKIRTGFNDKKLMGYIIYSEYTGGSMRLCDFNEVYPIGNKYYLTITLTTAAEVCEKKSDNLREDLNALYKSISFQNIQ